ncbi:hypothetical protein BCR44DRAFT_35654 [Catenaria anguillulae PL171]|uniref:Cysteine-rich protein n=1 Tax=Catenaria anguillulae PL171 TaxID=765915 RepID=A0A1Y2HZU7_9FUNG|nr:hypothetical protein BCR44DRAFT_35654 [Catenaria anguillulae PL171]
MRSATIIFTILVTILLCGIQAVNAGLVTYAACQSGCNIAVVACYAAAGVVFGVGSVPICNVQQGLCMATCAAMALTPTP